MRKAFTALETLRTQTMKIGYAQLDLKFGSVDSNIKNALDFIEIAAKLETELLVLPEYLNSGYPFRAKSETERLSEPIPDGFSCRALESAAREYSMFLVTSLCEKSEGKFYNAAVLFGPKGFGGKYRKTHLWDDEKVWVSLGDLDFNVFDIGKAKIGIMVCFDWRFPEVPRTLAIKGAEIICHPANLLLPYCQTAMLGAAVQNGVFIVTANRIGRCRGILYTGKSQIVDPTMKVLARSSSNKKSLKIVDVVPSRASNKQINRYNNLLGDRRPDLYATLLREAPLVEVKHD
jgi:predicted amidohydrolase